MTELSRDTFKLAIRQIAPHFGDVSANARLIGALSDAQHDLVVTPELSLTGYDLRDRTPEVAMATEDVVRRVNASCALLLGYVERGADGISYNAAAAVRNGRLLHNHRKVYLPTYGMFDEGRYFGRGTTVRAFELNGWRIGVLICEDFWHPALAYLLACQQVDLLIVMAAAPGRGVWEGGEFGPFASADIWHRMAAVTAQLHGIYVALCNRIGVEGGVTFAGGSVIAAPTGAVLAVAGAEERTLQATLDRAEIRRARTPYAHIRDEQPRLVLDELTRILDERS